MKISKNTTILLIVLLVIIGIIGTYFLMYWTGIGYLNLFSRNQTEYNDEELQGYITEFIKRQFGSNYQVADIFVFTDTPYYISVVEKDSGRGAFELLFDTYTGNFQPEPGPNMMWNRKYGMMRNGSWRGFNWNFERYNYSDTNRISRQVALKYAQQYLDKNREGVKVINDGHEFYGYYTFHTIQEDKPLGMLSVNGITGEVWYHDWHGELERIIELEEHDNIEEE
jgi:hypothetical protein